jgi:DNA adenine methylase
MKQTSQESIKPFLRWAGGKTWLQNSIQQYLPSKINNYHEPFLGGGSVFINLKSIGYIKNEAFLSDRNKELINSYDIIKSELEPLIELLKEYRNEKEFYYYLRSQNFQDKIQRAAQFIFLNRTSFNGIYRENLRGEYNVPYGFKSYKTLFDFDNFFKLRLLFENSFFDSIDFQDNLEKIERNDLVFLDPPYTVAHENNGFIKYNQKIFAWEDQIRLLEYIEHLKSKQAYFILTNAAHDNIDNLFKNVGKKIIVKRYSVVGGKGAKRKEISEYIFTNCKI